MKCKLNESQKVQNLPNVSWSWLTAGCSWGQSKWTEKLGGVWTHCSPLASPSLAIYSPYHHTYSMCISTVHYCCHRNVMHSVSYRLTQLIEIPCLICSGSFILILFWKGIVNTVWRRAERRGGKDEWTREKKEAGSSSLLFSPPLFPPSLSSLPPSLFSLMSVLSIGSQCESMVVIYTHTVALYYAHVAISSLILWPSVCLCRWLVQEEAGGAFRRRWHCWYSLCGDKEKFYLRWYRHWSHSGSGGFINHRMDRSYPYRSYLLSHDCVHL